MLMYKRNINNCLTTTAGTDAFDGFLTKLLHATLKTVATPSELIRRTAGLTRVHVYV